MTDQNRDVTKFYCGLESGTPLLEVAEPGFTTDTGRLFVGKSTGNKLVGGFLDCTLSGEILTEIGYPAPNKYNYANRYPYRSITGERILDNTDFFVECNSGGPFSVTLPTAVGITGRPYEVKNVGSGEVTVQTTSAQMIDGDPTKTLSQWEHVILISNGANWRVR